MSAGHAAQERRLAIAVAAIVFLVALLNVTPDLIGVFFDDAIYALVGKAIAEGQGFVYPQLPGTPPAIHYPPAFPLLLALVWKVAPPFPDSTMWLKLVNPIVLGLGALAAMRMGTRWLAWPPLAVAALVLLGFVSVPVLVLAGVLLSEPLFLATLFPALWAALRVTEDPSDRNALLAGALCGVVILTRTVGGVLLPAMLLTLALDRRWRAAALVAAVTIIAVLPWQLFVWKHAPGFPDVLRGSYGPYLEWVAGGYREGGASLVGAVLTKNLADAWSFLGIFFSPLVPALRPVLSVAVILATVAGVADGLRDRRTRVVALTVGGYLCIVFLWPYQIERFLWGAWPLLLLTAAAGLGALWRLARQVPPPRGLLASRSVLALAALLAVGHATYSARGLSRGWAGSASRRMSERMAPVVRFAVNEPRLAGRRIASDIAPALALYTGQQVISLDILRVTDHLGEKSLPERAAVIATLDSVFTPDVYVLLPDSPILAGFLRAERDPARHFREFTAPGLGVRAFVLELR